MTCALQSKSNNSFALLCRRGHCNTKPKCIICSSRQIWINLCWELQDAIETNLSSQYAGSDISRNVLPDWAILWIDPNSEWYTVRALILPPIYFICFLRKSLIRNSWVYLILSNHSAVHFYVSEATLSFAPILAELFNSAVIKNRTTMRRMWKNIMKSPYQRSNEKQVQLASVSMFNSKPYSTCAK